MKGEFLINQEKIGKFISECREQKILHKNSLQVF